jgi:hypothetical protein
LLPLLLIYEISALSYDQSRVTTSSRYAVLFLDTIIGYSGIHGPFVIGLLIICSILLSYFLRSRRKIPFFRISFFSLALIESAAYALFLGYVIGHVTQIFLSVVDGNALRLQLMLAVGAGFYEELFFRAFAFYMTAVMLVRLNIAPFIAYLIAALFSSFLFSYAHYANAATIALYPFLYRFLFGILFCVLYKLRGLGVCAWTHSLYDIFIYLPKWSLF